MNAERLLEVLDDLIALNARYEPQRILQQLFNDLSRVLQNPTHAVFQTQFAENLARLRDGWINMVNSFSPVQAKLAAEIGAAPFFLDEVPSIFEELVRTNNITPAVVLEEIEKFRVQRETYISTITNLRNGLNKIGIQPYELEPSSAEIGIATSRLVQQ
jgi:hypothetical protein